MEVRRHELSGLGYHFGVQLGVELAEFASEAPEQERALWVLEGIKAAENRLDEERREWVKAARAAGSTWDQIGDALGITKQAAAKRYSGS